MVSAISQFAAVRFSTSDLPERDRIATWREVVGRKLIRVEIEPFEDRPFHVDSIMRGLAGLRIVWARMSEFRVARTSGLLADGNSDFRLSVNVSGAETVTQRGRELALSAGDATLISMAETGSIVRSSPGQRLWFQVPYGVLAPLVSKVEDAVLRPIPSDTPALRLLRRYLRALEEDDVLTMPGLQHIAVTHICDLLAVALGATRDAAEAAYGRGVRAARLLAAKAFIVHNITRPDLSARSVAKRLGITPRYVHMLFETEGSSFAKFMMQHRLTHTRLMLFDPRFAHHTISMIAFRGRLQRPVSFQPHLPQPIWYDAVRRSACERTIRRA
jgi:AraC-like DNA-binding protein